MLLRIKWRIALSRRFFHSDETRMNPFNIQVLSASLQARVFPSSSNSVVSLSRLQLQAIELARQHLNQHSIPWESKRPLLPEIAGDFVPPLLAETLDDHFRVMAESISGPYMDAAQAFARLDWQRLADLLPQESDYRAFFSETPCSSSGWFFFDSERRFVSCPGGPAEEAVVFDVETAPQVAEFCKLPLIACALSERGLYLWLSPQLSRSVGVAESVKSVDSSGAVDVDSVDFVDSFDSVESVESVDAVDADSASTSSSATSSSTTSHSHASDSHTSHASTSSTDHLIPLGKPLLVIGHHVSFDRARIANQYSLERSPMRFLDTLSMHCAVAGISSQQRGLWKEQQKSSVQFEQDEGDGQFDQDEQDDQEQFDQHNQFDQSEHNQNAKWCKFGSLNGLKDALKLHCNIDLDKSVRSDVLLSATGMAELREHLPRIAQYCAADVFTTAQLFSALLPKFLRKSPHPATFSALLEMSTFLVPIESKQAWQAYMDKCEHLLQAATQQLHAQLESLVEATLAQFPPGSPDPVDDPWLSQLDWQRADTLRWTKPKFLRDGKTYAKGGEPRPIGNARLHQQPAWYRKLWKAGRIRVTPRTAIVPLLLRLRWKDQPVALIPGRGWCYSVAEGSADEEDLTDTFEWNGKTFRKIPHPGGRDDNVGSLLTKNFFKFFESKQLWSPEQEQLIKHVLSVNSAFSFWIGYRERIREQLVVEDAEGLAFLIPAVMPMGTVTRRAVEKTWLTAANAKEGLVGSELKTLVKAPRGWSLVGADVDSQELWIGALLGDAQFGWSGATALGWMALQGSKSDGSDLHSRTATILGMSRDQAKIFNYGRIYGAGVKYAAQLLLRFNPAMSAAEAAERAQALYHRTKGKRIASRRDAFVAYAGGTESFMFNQMEAIAKQPAAHTPVLKAQLSDGLIAAHVDNEFLTSRVNWVVQSSGVDYLHLMLVAMEYLMRRWRIGGRVALCIHDELRFLVPEQDRLRAALALQVANLWVRAAFVQAVGVADLPLSVAFFSAVDVDWVLRKEVHMACRTPSQPHVLSPGESYDIYRLLQECPSLGHDYGHEAVAGVRRVSPTRGVAPAFRPALASEADYLALLKKQIYGSAASAVVTGVSAGSVAAGGASGASAAVAENAASANASSVNSAASANAGSVESSPSAAVPGSGSVQEHFKRWQELIRRSKSSPSSSSPVDSAKK